MTRKKNINSCNLLDNKCWISSWYVHKKEYSILVQNDLLLILYTRSLLFDVKFCNFIGVRNFRFNDNLILDFFFVL